MQIKELASRLGLAAPTVSEILHNPERALRYSLATRKRVEAAARKHGFRPNASARTMTSGRFNVISLVYIHTRPFLPIHLINGLLDGCSVHRQRLQLDRLSDSNAVTDGRHIPAILREHAVDGLIVEHLFDLSQGMLETLSAAQLPLIWLNKKLAADCVRPDDRHDAAEGTRRLLEAGHRRIAYLHPAAPYDHYSITDRRDGYADAMAEAGLRPRVIRLKPDGDDRHYVGDGVTRMRAVLAADDRPTAVVAYEHGDALQSVQAAVAIGMIVPRDLSIVSFSAQPVSQFGVPITTKLINFGDIGREAIRLVIEKIAAPSTALPPVVVSSAECVGDSIRPPCGG